jgi:ribonuclease HII
MQASFELEAVEIKLHGGPVVGVDDSGRSPLAGPVVAAAVVLDPLRIPVGIADRRGLAREARNALHQAILANAQVGIGVALLPCRPKLALIDGNKAPRLDCNARTIIHGDAKCLSIAAASLVARVTRDALMDALARQYPDYGFERNKGYATREHRAAIAAHGVTPQHRRSFRPVQLALGLA